MEDMHDSEKQAGSTTMLIVIITLFAIFYILPAIYGYYKIFTDFVKPHL